MDWTIFIIAGLATLIGAGGVVLSSNPVHSALSLVMTLFGIAVLFVAQQAHLLAAVQVIVYAGAIVVLFLFVIMLLGVDRSEDLTVEPLGGQRMLAVVAGLLALAGVLVLARSGWVTGARSVGGPASGEGSNVEKLANSIFSQYVLAFEVTSVLLVIAVVGAVVLVRRRVNIDQEDDEAPAVAASPPPDGTSDAEETTPMRAEAEATEVIR